jgi:transposase
MPVPLRSDFDPSALRSIARRSKDGPQARRLLALAAIYEGATRTEAARIGGVTLQIVRDWVVRFNAHGPEGLIDRKPPGKPSRLTDSHRAALMARIDDGPIPSVHGVVRWRLVDLIEWLWEEFRVTISKQTLSREVRALGYRKLSARPRHHAKSDAEVSTFKKPFPPVWRRSPRAQAASRLKSGFPMRRGSGRRTRSPAAGHGGAPVPRLPRTNARHRPTSSGRSARIREKARVSSYPAARAKP